MLKQFLSGKIISAIITPFLWILPVRLRVKIAGAVNTVRQSYKVKPYQPGAYPEGVNLFGYLKAQMGLGQGARLMAHAVLESGIPHSLINVSIGNPASHNEKEFEAMLSKASVYNTNIVHINPEQTPLLRVAYPRRTWDKRYNIAVWLWELEEFPSEWHSEFAYFDEIWTPSTFTSNSIKNSTSLPVVTVPYGLRAEADTRFDRDYFRLPKDRFLFLSMYDVNSTMERKNPMGAIDAFCAAFPPDSMDVGLVIKINNATPENIAQLKTYIGNRKNIFVISQLFSKVEVQSLIKACDVFVSLHRSEGFGLVMAEAMVLGVPSIATNWSANTDFMKPDTSCLVDFKFIDVKDSYYQQRQGLRWADPNIEHAAQYMQRLYNDRPYYENIAQNGQAFIKGDYSIERSAQKIFARLRELDLIKTDHINKP